MVSNTCSIVFLFCFSSSCELMLPGSLNFDCPFGIPTFIYRYLNNRYIWNTYFIDLFFVELKASLRKLEHENADLKFLNNQYVQKARQLEKESREKSDRILHLQEKNFQAVVQTPGKIYYLTEMFSKICSIPVSIF
jgi:hypothetical protein